MNILLLFSVSFFVSVVLPIYLIRIKHKYAAFWFNILPIAMGTSAGQAAHTMIWGEFYSGFYGLMTYFGVFLIALVLTIVLINALYFLLFKEKIDFPQNIQEPENG